MVAGGRNSNCSAVSLPEVLVAVAVIAIMVSIGIPAMRNVIPGTSGQTAERNLNYLNGAVVAFNQAAWELVLTANNGSSDELAIFNSLRYRDTTNPMPGSPYLPATTLFVVSTNASDYRAQWNGRMFELAMPGTSGVGIDLLKMSGAAAQPFGTNTPVPRQTN